MEQVLLNPLRQRPFRGGQRLVDGLEAFVAFPDQPADVQDAHRGAAGVVLAQLDPADAKVLTRGTISSMMLVEALIGTP